MKETEGCCIALTQERFDINRGVADSHTSHGFKAVPMVDDHRNGNVPTYMNPRK
jgi:hypothetical protein